MKYETLLNLEVRHDYYRTGACPDFRIRPTRATQRRLDNHHCLLRETPSGLTVSTSVKDKGRPELPLGDVQLTFVLELLQPDLDRFTDLDALADHRALTFRHAAAAPEAAVPLSPADQTATGSETRSVQEPSNPEVFRLAGHPRDDVRQQHVTTKPAAAAVVGYDETHRDLSLDTSSLARGTDVVVQYPVNVPRPARTWAEVEISGHGEPLARWCGQPPTFAVQLEARRVPWVYYVISHADNSDLSFEVKDGDEERKPAPLTFQSVNTGVLGTAAFEDEVPRLLATQFPGAFLTSFLTDEPVPCSESGLKNLQLSVEGRTVAAHLPSPGHARRTRVTRTDGPDEVSTDALFEVINLVRNPSSTLVG